MRSATFEGAIADGDRVRLRRSVDIGAVETPSSIENLTTGVTFRARGENPARPADGAHTAPDALEPTTWPRSGREDSEARRAPAAEERDAPALLRGHVRNLLWQTETAIHMNACRFQIDRQDEYGERLRSIPVEMRSMSFSGTLNNGDEVVLRRSLPLGRLEVPRTIENVTTGVPFTSTVGVVNRLRALPPWLLAITATAFGIWLVFMASIVGALA
jgi:hypothetical protein